MTAVTIRALQSSHRGENGKVQTGFRVHALNLFNYQTRAVFCLAVERTKNDPLSWFLNFPIIPDFLIANGIRRMISDKWHYSEIPDPSLSQLLINEFWAAHGKTCFSNVSCRAYFSICSSRFQLEFCGKIVDRV